MKARHIFVALTRKDEPRRKKAFLSDDGNKNEQQEKLGAGFYFLEHVEHDLSAGGMLEEGRNG